MRICAAIWAITLLSTSAWAQTADPFSSEDTSPSAEEDSDPLLDGGQTAIAKTTPVTAGGETTLALNPTTALGIGVGFTIPGTPAVMAHKYISPSLGVQAGLAFDIASFSAGPAGMEVDGSVVTFGGVAYGAYRLKATNDFTINALGGFELGMSNVSFGSGAASVSESGLDFRIAAGLQGELFVFKRVSVYAQVGLTLAFLGDVSTAKNQRTFPDPTRNTSSIALQVGPTAMVQSFGLVWWL